MITPKRRWLHPLPGDDWQSLASRALPDVPVEEAVSALQSWNLHLVFRPPPPVITCADIVFIEPPAAG